MNIKAMHFDELIMAINRNVQDKSTVQEIAKELRRRTGEMSNVELISKIESVAADRAREKSIASDAFYATKLNTLENEALRRMGCR